LSENLGLGGFEYSDNVIGVSSKEDRSITVPCKGQGLSVGKFGVELGDVLVQFTDKGLALEIPNLDSASVAAQSQYLVGLKTS